MRNDPAETGGLFIGRRPGTAPVRYVAVLAFNIWFFVIEGPGSGWTPPIGKGW